MNIDDLNAAAKEASRQRAIAMFLDAHNKFAEYLDAPLTAMHAVLADEYGRPFLRITPWAQGTDQRTPTQGES